MASGTPDTRTQLPVCCQSFSFRLHNILLPFLVSKANYLTVKTLDVIDKFAVTSGRVDRNYYITVFRKQKLSQKSKEAVSVMILRQPLFNLYM